MDPISILTSVSATSRAAFSLSTTLSTFVRDTRDINQSVRAFYDEVTGLILTLDAIGRSVETVGKGRGKQPQNPELWRSVAASLNYSRRAVDRMRNTLKGVKKPSSHVFGQALRAFKMSFKEEEIKTLKSHIQSHNAALQLALQMINVHLTSRTSGLVVDALVARIELLLTNMVLHQSQLAVPANRPNRATSASSSGIENQSGIADLVISAHDVLNEARSIVAQSEVGSDGNSIISSLLQDMDLLEHDFQDNVTVIQGYQSDRNVERNTNPRVRNWIQGCSSDFDSASVATQIRISPSQSPGDTSTLLRSGYSSSATGDESDEDNYLEEETSQAILSRMEAFIRTGLSSYERGEWHNSQESLESALQLAGMMSSDKIRLWMSDLEDAHFKLALCSFHQTADRSCKATLETATNELYPFRTTKPKPNENEVSTARRIVSTYLFAEICFTRDNVEEAAKQCRKAHSMKRKWLGTQHPWLEPYCFSLLSELAQRKQDFLSADIFKCQGLDYTLLAAVTERKPKFLKLEFGWVDTVHTQHSQSRLHSLQTTFDVSSRLPVVLNPYSSSREPKPERKF